MEYTINHNDQFNSIEITFDGKPSEAVRDALKALKFRWHGVKKVWYGYKTEEEVKAAIDGKPSEGKTAVTEPAVNSLGVKVGDLFSMSWGYEQTNVDYFQVVALVGASSVRVRGVCPEMIAETPTCGMAADRTYRTNTNGELLPAHRSVFINDDEKGDVKRLSLDGTPYIKMKDHRAHKCMNDTETVYESWYY